MFEQRVATADPWVTVVLDDFDDFLLDRAGLGASDGPTSPRRPRRVGSPRSRPKEDQAATGVQPIGSMRDRRIALLAFEWALRRLIRFFALDEYGHTQLPTRTGNSASVG
jgi:hypothetical protein